MPTPLTDADKVIRNDTGKEIAAAIRDLAAPEADKVAYDNTSSGLTADNAQDAIDELKTKNDTKMNKANPTGTGTFSMNRASDAPIGEGSFAEGVSCRASGDNGSHAEGYNTKSEGRNSHSEGRYTIANHRSQHVFGEYNDPDPSANLKTARGTYVEIVGKGSNDENRSNARTLDWNGNETLAGGLKLHTNQDASTLNVSSSIAAGATYDFTSYSDGTVIFVYRPSDSGQSDYTGIYIRAGNWQRLIPIKEAPNVTTSGYVLTNGNSQALRCAIIST